MPRVVEVWLASELTCSILRAQVRGRHGSCLLLASGEDLVAAVLLVHFGEGSRHVHLDNVCAAHAGLVGAEADFAFLGVGDDALLGAAEVVVEQILEPHAGR